MRYFGEFAMNYLRAVAIESNIYVVYVVIYIISRLTTIHAHTLRCSWLTRGGGVVEGNVSGEGLMEKCYAKRRIFNFLPAEKIFFVIRENIH